VAGCDPPPARVEAVSEQYGFHGYFTVEEFLARDDIALLTVVTPSAMHHEHVLQVLKAGKHRIVEQRPVMSVAERDEMGELSCNVGGKETPEQRVLRLEQMLASGQVGSRAELARRLGGHSIGDHRGPQEATGGPIPSGLSVDHRGPRASEFRRRKPPWQGLIPTKRPMVNISEKSKNPRKWALRGLYGQEC